MTTDELVESIVEMLLKGDLDQQYMKHMREVKYGFLDSGMVYSVYSVALNDETRDVRYVQQNVQPILDAGAQYIEAYEVNPMTVVKTEYRRV